MKTIALFLIAASLFCVSSTHAAQPALVTGTYQKGSNNTEPRPKRSTYLETLHGGVVVMPEGAGFYLFTRVIKKPENELYVTVEYENPLGGKPFVNDMAFVPTAEALHFSAPEFIRGLKSYGDYKIVVRVFESRSATEPIDTLKQSIRSYVDTRGEKPKLFKRLKQKQ